VKDFGLFASRGAEYTLDNGSHFLEGETGPGLPHIDYDTIEPNNLQKRLESRLRGWSNLNRLVDPEFKIRCIR
jgi:hypothetical protein